MTTPTIFRSLFPVVSLLLPAAALAQEDVSSFVLPAEIVVSSRGWSQIRNTPEMIEFALAVLEATFLISLIAFHPVNRRHQRSHADFELPRSLFLIGLTGMLVGFLVVHHGYLIGFVVFGLGSLFRFRMNNVSADHAGQMIVVTLVCLAVGLDLPVMALTATIATWVIIWAFGRSRQFRVEVKITEGSDIAELMGMLRDRFAAAGFQTLAASKAHYKSRADFVLSSTAGDAEKRLLHLMSQLHADDAIPLTDWQIE